MTRNEAQRSAELRVAREQLGAVIDEIRSLPGYSDFRKPPTFSDVAAASIAEPILYLSAAPHGGIALKVDGGAVRSVELPQLNTAAVHAAVKGHLATYQTFIKDPQGRRAEWNVALDELCAWLWGAVIESLLPLLAGAHAVTIIAGGLLGLLPLHAAWTPDAAAPTGRRYAIDAVAISYAPNAAALRRARVLGDSQVPRRLLAVIDPRPVSGSKLPWAHVEGLAVQARFGADPIVLCGGAATRGNFLRHAPEADVIHLACHGYAHLDEPMRGGLRMAGDRDASLADLMDMPLAVRLAVLSACETALPGIDLPDEVVALATGLLQAGVAGVIASLWAVPDRSTAMLMTAFYDQWTRDLTRSPRTALRSAQRWLRDSSNEEKRQRWLEMQEDSAEKMPPEVTDEFIRALDYRDPNARDECDIGAWGAFTHVGI